MPPRVLLILLLTALISVIVLGISELAFLEIESAGSAERQTTEARQQLEAMRQAMSQAESAQRGYLITADERYLQPFQGAIDRLRRSRADLLRLAALLPSLREPLQQMAPLIDEKLDELALTVHYSQQGNRIDAIQIVVSNRGVTLMEEIEKQGQRLRDELDRLAQARAADLHRIYLLQRLGVGLIVLLNLVFLAILGVRTVRHFTERDRHRAELARQAQALEHTVAERTEELSSLSSYLQASHEREKGRLARDLHDELGGILTAAKIDASWLEGFAAAGGPDVQQRMKRLQSSLDEAVELKRRVIEHLRPSLLDHLGLGPAVEWFVEETCGKAGLAHEVVLEDADAPVPPELAIAVYRIVQESMANAVQYANAKRVRVALAIGFHDLTLAVEDDGVGIADFRPDHLPQGIAGMRQRARSLGGSLSVETAPGQGTAIRVRFTLPQTPPTRDDDATAHGDGDLAAAAAPPP
ncbi:CHASE3 domain-containing protein [Aquabacterium sp. J223]|uniref:CHASE3 domain-containing protein n=1 Tax=Aquabacterium sp. J223 TaxID=2898431 RepID=UPI0021ADBDC5|nr:CHASE3 domain-containing protein [Aquabacterium sp. J223]UUX96042.1 CHASE3 domain-containing protein [Aquabacterium sp. J223]